MSKVQVLIAGQLLSDVNIEVLEKNLRDAFIGRYHRVFHKDCYPSEYSPVKQDFVDIQAYLDMLYLLAPDWVKHHQRFHSDFYKIENDKIIIIPTLEEVFNRWNEKYKALKAQSTQ